MPENSSKIVKDAGRSAVWQVIGGGWHTIVRLAASIILARVLMPGDFGLFGMALIAQELIQNISAFGMGAGIIAKQDVTDEDICTCFWIMAGVRIVTFLIAFFSAPLAGMFFNDDRVIAILRVISLTFLFSILSSVSTTLLTKELKFGPLNLIRGVAILIESGTAVTLALTTDLKYWSLISAMLVSALFTDICIFIYAKWIPKFKFSYDSFKYMFNFGIHGLGFRITNYLHQNIDYLIIGRLLGSSNLGLYEFAYRIPHIVLERFSKPVGQVVFPALAKYKNSNSSLIMGYAKTAKYIALVTFPALGGLAVLSYPTISILWGSKWLAATIPLQILCGCAAFRSFMSPIASVFLCKDRPDINFKISVINLIFTVPVLSFFGFYWGLVGVASGVLVSTLPYLYSIYLAFKLTQSSVKILLFELSVPFLSSLVCMASAYAVNKGLTVLELNFIIAYISAVLAGALSYCGCIVFVFKNTKTEIFDYISILIPSGK